MPRQQHADRNKAMTCDAMGTVGPDPNGAGRLKHRAQ
jgi:hypothetical protein